MNMYPKLMSNRLNVMGSCRNPSLELMIEARACKGVGQKLSMGVTFHAPKSLRKCEGMNPHTLK